MGAEEGGEISGSRHLPDEIAFLTLFGIDPLVLRLAAGAAERSGVSADRTLLSQGMLPARLFYQLLALHLDVPFMEKPLPALPYARPDQANRIDIVPLLPNPADLAYAIAPRGAALGLVLRQNALGRWSDRGRVAITTPQRLAALVRLSHRDAIVRHASQALSDWNADLSASTGLNTGQLTCGAVLSGTLAYGFWRAPALAMGVLGLIASPAFLALILLRLAATIASPPAERAMVARRDDADLPVYTVVVALYREERIVPDLVEAISRLDYPAAKLDIKIVLEADDERTRKSLERQRLPERFEIIVAPPGQPRTKPRALNMALRSAIGRYLVVFDAEDKPATDQLRLAVERFEAGGASLACLQARLAIDNSSDSWLAALFALEYAALFDVINPGLARLGLPLPLGGTSNHFRTDVLRAVRGWDAWNVTEDIDLGLRLARFGYGTAMLPSSTREEATHTLRAWLGQRRRWQKGWIATLRTHSRDLDRLVGDMGIRNALAACALVGGTVASTILFPIFFVWVCFEGATGALFTFDTPWRMISGAITFTVIASGLASLFGPILLGMQRRSLYRLARKLPLLPAYLALVSFATWQACWEFVHKPYGWTKTEHGTAKHRLGPGDPIKTRPRAGSDSPPRRSDAGW